MKKMSGNKIIGLSQLANYLELFKIHLSIYISLSALFGYVMASGSFSLEAFLTGIFVFTLACGSASLNNIQDRKYDVYFERTRYRSLVQKKVPLSHAYILASVMIGTGLLGLLFNYGTGPFFIGILALVFYNGLYTPLKKSSLLAIIPGAITGMLPPLIGWSAAGKSFFSNDISIIMVIFGLWQIPHFFLVLLKNNKTSKNREEMKNRKAGKNGYSKERGLEYPCFLSIFSEKEIKLQILIWTSLYSLGILLFLISGPIISELFLGLAGLNAIVILTVVIIIMVKNNKAPMLLAFAAINLSMLFFMAAGIGDKCLM